MLKTAATHIPAPPHVRGQPASSRRLVVRRHAAIGDCVAASIVIDKLIEQGYDPCYETHPAIHCVLRRHPKLAYFQESGKSAADVMLDGVYERHPLRRRLHFYDIFLTSANEQLARYGIYLGPALNCKPRIKISPLEKRMALERFKEYPKPWVFVCPRSDAFACRQIPDGIWNEAARSIKGTKFWIGRHPAPPNFVDLKCNHLDTVLVFLSAADLLVTVDTGPMHLAAAMGVPVLAIGQSSSPELHLGDQTDFQTISPPLDCLNCQKELCPINEKVPPCQNVDPDFIAHWANQRLQSITTENVSAVIPVYGSDPKMIQRCLDCVLPQVQEVIVTAETADKMPRFSPNGKIRAVIKDAKGIGYGRNENFGIRHSTGKYQLHLNDDVFLAPGAVEGMMRAMKPDTGMVCGILRWPDGLIYHCGKRRTPGHRAWGHIDLRQKDCTVKQDTEMENLNGACVLVRRKAHFECDGFDEDFTVYCDDDAYALRLRRAGWKLVFTPVETGQHLEHQSTQKLGDIMGQVKRANDMFTNKFGKYFDHNAANAMGNFDY